MAFTLKNYIKRGLIAAVGKMADYQIILNSVGWMEKGVLTEDDLMEIQEAVDVDDAPYTYAETDTKIPDPFDPETATEDQLRERLADAETAAKILLGEEDAT